MDRPSIAPQNKSHARPYRQLKETPIPSAEFPDWSGCPLVELIPGKVSGAPLLVGTRLPVGAITENDDAFLPQGPTPKSALAETLDCHPHPGLNRIRPILHYRAQHKLQTQS